MCLSLGAPLPDLLSPITLDGWRLTIGCNTPSSTLLRHPPMVMNSWVPILVGDAAHAALLLDMGTQEPKVTEYLPIDRQGGNMGSPGTRLLTSQEAVMAAQLGVPEAAPMTQGRHLLVAPKVPDVVGVRHLAPDAGDEQYPACHPALGAISPLLLLREETCQITCVQGDHTPLNHWLLEQGSTMIIRIDLAIGAIGVTIALMLALIALPEDVQDHRYLHRYLHLALLGQIGSMQVIQMTTFALIMVIR